MKNHKIYYLLFILCLILSCIKSTSIQASETDEQGNFAKIDAYIKQEMDSYDIPGLSLGIVHGDDIIYTKGYGIANQNKEPVTEDTPFYIGSVGKTFTALAIRQLENEGKLKIDDLIPTYLPWFTLADNSGKEITIENLLLQTSGLTTVSGNQPYTYDADDSLEELVKKINRYETTVRPVGSAYEYSNLNYLILGLIVETVSGMSYEDYLNNYIFDPINMESSYASKAKAKEDGLAQGYRNVLGFNIPLDYEYPIAQVPSGFQLSTAKDMSQYLIYFLNNGYGGGKSILPDNQLQTLEDSLASFRNTQPYYGLDWGITRDAAMFSHNRFYGFLGATPNFNSALLISQVHRYGVVVLVNQRNSYYTPDLTAEIIGYGVTDILLGQSIPPSVTREGDIKQWAILLFEVILGAFTIYSCVRFRKTSKKKLATLCMILLNFLLPILFLIVVPLYYHNDWKYFLSFRLEYTLPVFTLVLLQLVTGFIKLYMLCCNYIMKKQQQIK